MSFTTTALAALTLTILALGAPSTKMAYALDTDPGFMRVRAGGETGLAPAHKYSIAAPAVKWGLAASVLDTKGGVRVHVIYKSAGPWDSKDACAAFAVSDDADLDEATSALLEASIKTLGSGIQAVGLSCVPVQG